MLRTEKRMRICITLLIMNLAFIWGNSLLPGEVSGAVSDWVKDALHDLLPSSGSASAGGSCFVSWRTSPSSPLWAPVLAGCLPCSEEKRRRRCFWELRRPVSMRPSRSLSLTGDRRSGMCASIFAACSWGLRSCIWAAPFGRTINATFWRISK